MKRGDKQLTAFKVSGWGCVGASCVSGRLTLHMGVCLQDGEVAVRMAEWSKALRSGRSLHL